MFVEILYMFIAIEGLDGVGKSTIGKALADRVPAKLLKTPQQSLNLFHKFFQSRSPSKMSLIFYYLSVFAISFRIRFDFSKKNYICVRYFDSTIAYHAAFNLKLPICHYGFLIKKPDIVVFLILDENERKKRLSLRSKLSVIDSLSNKLEVRNKILDHYYNHLISSLTIDITGKSVDKIVSIIMEKITNLCIEKYITD